MARIELEEEFYEDEVREGFYVPACIKQAWGAQIRVLNDIDEVCAKLGIRYFADWGTLLGAVRHGGFIPWDDDFDLCMFRDDYTRFLYEGLKLMPDGYEIYNLQNREGHDQFLANVVAKSRICFEPEHLERFHGFPYISAVDIFIIDYISPDENEHNRIKDAISRILGISDGIREGKLKGDKLDECLSNLEKNTGLIIPDDMPEGKIRQQLDVKAEKLFAYFVDRKNEARQVVQMMPWGLNDKKIMPAEYYKRTVDLPFEKGTIPVPVAYNEVLRIKYGEYMCLYKNAGAHDYPFFDKSRANLQEVLDFELPEYNVDGRELYEKAEKRRNQLSQSPAPYVSTYKQIVDECLQEMKKLIDSMDSCADNIVEVCAKAQELAIDLGTYMEVVKGEGYDIVRMLEGLCESFYELTVKSSGESIDKMIRSVSDDFGRIERKIHSRKEVLFLPFKDTYWKTMEPYFHAFNNDEDTDVFVVPIPYYYKDYKHVLKNMQYRIDLYPSDIRLTDYDNYDYSVHHPDMIFIQNPYDEVNDEMSVPPFFYSSRLLELTDRLVYVPWFETNDFTHENEREYKNMKHYCTVPGVINADIVIVPSVTMRETYIEKLCDFTGEETKPLWERKIVVKGSNEENELIGIQLPTEKPDVSKKEDKVLLYFPDVSDLIERKDRAIDKMQTVIRIFEENSKQLKFLILKGAYVDSLLMDEDPKLYEKYNEILDRAGNCPGVNIINEDEKDYDSLVNECSAYYGDPGRLAHMFRNAGKSVMIQNYELLEQF